MSVRTNNAPTPVERICAAAREFVLRTYEQQRRGNRNIEYPTVPDYADFQAYLGPYIRREIIQTILKLGLHKSLDEMLQLCRELNAIEWQISDNELTRIAETYFGRPKT